jgi:hypothetical protein
MEYSVCDEFLYEGQPCGAVVAFPEQHRAWHAYIEEWLAWAAQTGAQAYKKDKDKGDETTPDVPRKPDKIRY